MKHVFPIENRLVGRGQKCFLIGEVGSNHNLDKGVVRGLIDACAEAGFDAVKFQIYDAKEAFSSHVTTADVKLDHLYGLRPWWEVARDKILMPRDWFGEMFEYARASGLIPFSAIHRLEDALFLEQFGLPVLKIASIDLHYHHLLKKLTPLKKPMIVSTGMAYMSEIDETMRMLEAEGQDEVALLHCVSCYPPRPAETNLRNIETLAETFNVPAGFSDHTTGIACAVAAVALGACMIEKHITLDRTFHGPDHPFALEPKDMILMAQAVRETEEALGSRHRVISPNEMDSRLMIRRSVVSRVDIAKGQPVILESIKFARPGTGIPTNDFRLVEGRKAACDIPAETIIAWDMLA
ncbi:MAG: N-acetylneuraminate synthase family protein [Humidesulfovibrio sp.]|uniref:N-acetylneuraminate synthase family protein n=1 Tax=Humidesulfovibrio sp. TaxID=2910988 RepID=UPI0027E66146|nr:N-acetylneuraminate synthase family protein [Humidesulfovibrio sp.]MDQ7834324.1 N-acetylneuraminate synthase family protein [Humidesulfovibrio sp.]